MAENCKYIKIEGKVNIYKELLKNILIKCKIAKGQLDMYHSTLYKINSIIQLTVIYFSATSTFLQALISDDNDNDIVEVNDSMNNTNMVDENNYINFLDTTTLAITSYSSLIISLARHFKIEERVGNISNLIDRFAEIISRIQYNLELLKPWESIEKVKSALDNHGDNIIEKDTEWITTEDIIKKEYIHILDIKKELIISYEKIIGESIYKHYRKIFNNLKDYYNNNKDEDEGEVIPESNNTKSCWCIKPKCFCCKCGCNMNKKKDKTESDKNECKCVDESEKEVNIPKETSEKRRKFTVINSDIENSKNSNIDVVITDNENSVKT